MLQVRQPLAAVSRDTGLIDIVAVGEDSRMYHKAYDGFSWSEDWTLVSSGGDFMDEAPALVASTRERLDVFARLRTTKKLMHSSWTNGSWAVEWNSPDKSEKPEFDRKFVVASSRVGQVDLFETAGDQVYYRSVR